MGYRRSTEQVKSRRDWRAFVAHNQTLIDAAGLPLIVTESVDHWDDFLIHGYLDHHDDPTGFVVNQLNERQYRALVRLIESYFVAGYGYFTTCVLRDEDKRLMSAKFDKE
jgi:hypothetical protein